MAWPKPPFYALVAIGLAAVGLMLQIIGICTKKWISMSPDYLYRPLIETGLWNWCSDGAEGCVVPNWLYACRAFGILGAITLAASLTAALIPWRKRILILRLSTGLAFAAALFIMIQFSIYADFVKVSALGFEYWYRSSFALTVLAFLFALAAGTIFLMAIFNKKYD